MRILSDISQLRLEINIFQAKVKGMYRKGHNSAEIASQLYVPEKSIRVIIKWLMRKGEIDNERGRNQVI